MKFQRDFIDKIKESTNLVELVSEYTELKQEGRYIWRGKCPHPDHDDSTASFTINTRTNSWCCYGCHSDKKGINNNYGSDCIAFIQWINQGKMNWVQSVEYLAKRINLPLPEDKNLKIYYRNKKLNEKFIRDLNQRAKQYCFKRELDSYDIAKFELGYDSIEDRLTFPLYDQYNNIVGFNKRRMDDVKDKKYIHSSNSSVFNKSSYLYNINNVDRSLKYIFITEGVMDVILASKYGLNNVVCTLGCSFTEKHIEIIQKLGLTPVLLYDNDEKGQLSIRSAADLIYSKGQYPLVYILPVGYDLADFSLEKRYKTKDIIYSGIITYGYMKAKDIILNYLNELYLLKAKYRPEIDKTLQLVPEQERDNIKTFIREEIRM